MTDGIVVGVIGSRRRNTEKDNAQVIIKLRELHKAYIIKKIVTGDCNACADEVARKVGNGTKEIDLEVKRIKNPKTGQEMVFDAHEFFEYFTMCEIFYKRDEEIAKEPLDFLVAQVAPDRTGGTEVTIKYFKKHHKDWRKKLILI